MEKIRNGAFSVARGGVGWDGMERQTMLRHLLAWIGIFSVIQFFARLQDFYVFSNSYKSKL